MFFCIRKPHRFGLWLRKSFSKRRRQTVYQLHCEDIQGGFKCPTQSMACEVGYPIHAEIPERCILRRKVGSNGKDFETDGVTLSLQQSAPRLYFYAGRDALLYSFTGYLKRKSRSNWGSWNTRIAAKNFDVKGTKWIEQRRIRTKLQRTVRTRRKYQ